MSSFEMNASVEDIARVEREAEVTERRRKILAAQGEDNLEFLPGEDVPEEKQDKHKPASNNSIDNDDDDDKEISSDEGEDVEVDFTKNIGCEKRTEDFNESGTKFTGFSMDEELEEGYFNKKGAYVLRKNEEEPDAWLASMDWNKSDSYNTKHQDAEQEVEEEVIDVESTLAEIAQILQENESVTKALNRLRGKKKQIGRKKPQPANKKKQEEEGEGDPEKFKLLTGLANKIVSSGHFGIYTDTKEKIESRIKKKSISDIVISGSGTTSFKRTTNEKDEISHQQKKVAIDESEKDGNDEDLQTVKWIYKWSAEMTETFGPYDSETMDKWKEDGMFNDDVQCCKVGTELYYPIKRVDFDLYT